MANKSKINDWLTVTTLFDKLNKQLEKTMRTAQTTTVPKFYFRCLARLEDSVEAVFADKPTIKKFSSTNSKAFNSIRQRLRKHQRDDPVMAAGVAAAREKMESTDEEMSDSDSDSDDEGAKPQTAADDDDDGFETVGKGGKTTSKKDTSGSGAKPAEVLDVMKCPKEKITYEMVDKKLKEIIASRGKKGTDRHENVESLIYLAEVSKCAAQEIEVLIMLISAQFDISGSMSTHMPIPIWKRCVNNLLRVRQLLSANSQITLTETAEPEARPAADEIVAGAPVQLWGSLCAFAERLDDEYFKSMQSIDPHTKEYVFRMQDEALFIILANEVISYYVERNNTEVVCKLSLRLLEHLYYKPATVYEALRKFATAKLAEADELAVDEKKAAAARAAKEEADARRAKEAEEEGDEYLDDEDADEAEAKEASEIPYPAGFTFPAPELPDVLSTLSLRIYKDGDERSKARAMLCDIFNKGLEGDFRRGRDLMLMSHLQENISHTDIATQILFNRAMAQLGLSAFRAGLFTEAQACLSELYMGGRVRELLAQGVTQSRFHERSVEQEKLERRRQMPFHMHVNLELLESVHLVCSMLQEVPYMANSMRRARSNNKPFARLVDNYERQTFNGPPDNIRDHIMAATRKMLDGKWKDAKELILGLDVWKLLPGDKDAVLVNVTRRLKEEAMRTYLFQFAAQYASVSLDILAEMFELDFKAAYSLVSRMIMSEELQGMCDDVTRTVVMSHVEPSRLQSLAMTFAEKCAVLLDANERALELHVGAGGAQLFDFEDEAAAGPSGGRGSRRGGRVGRGGDGDDDGNRRGGRGGRGGGGGRDDGGRGGGRRRGDRYGSFHDGDFSKRGGGKFKSKKEANPDEDRKERMVSLGGGRKPRGGQWR